MVKASRAKGEGGSDLGGNWPRAGTSQRGMGMVGGVWMGVTGMSKQHKAVGNESNNKSTVTTSSATTAQMDNIGSIE